MICNRMQNLGMAGVSCDCILVTKEINKATNFDYRSLYISPEKEAMYACVLSLPCFTRCAGIENVMVLDADILTFRLMKNKKNVYSLCLLLQLQEQA